MINVRVFTCISPLPEIRSAFLSKQTWHGLWQDKRRDAGADGGGVEVHIDELKAKRLRIPKPTTIASYVEVSV
jgi:hypothetical protein